MKGFAPGADKERVECSLLWRWGWAKQCRCSFWTDGLLTPDFMQRRRQGLRGHQKGTGSVGGLHRWPVVVAECLE